MQVMKKFASVQRRRCNTHQVKRKATEIQEDVAIHKERTRRITNEHARAEGDVNNGIGPLGKALQAAAKAAHSLTCGEPDRERNETMYAREATELVEEWQHQLLSEQPMSGRSFEQGEVFFGGAATVTYPSRLVVSFISLSFSS